MTSDGYFDLSRPAHRINMTKGLVHHIKYYYSIILLARASVLRAGYFAHLLTAKRFLRKLFIITGARRRVLVHADARLEVLHILNGARLRVRGAVHFISRFAARYILLAIVLYL